MNNKILMNQIDFSIGSYSCLYITINFDRRLDKQEFYKIYYNHDDHIIKCIVFLRESDDDDYNVYFGNIFLYSIHEKCIYINRETTIDNIKEYILDLISIFDDIDITISYSNFSSDHEITIHKNETTPEKFIQRSINMFNIFIAKNKNKQ